jgi:nitroimidazol reductase NimA-like FMN-containing flavoprotein (pyridoxamine 5'-phosphate oxidase superfamily)
MPNTTPARMNERATSTDRAALDALLDAAVLAHVAFSDDDGHPVVLPTGFARDRDRVLIHGSTGSRWMRRLAEGSPAAVAVTALEGIVVARTGFESSFHYRSAVLFGTFTALEGGRKAAALDRLTDRLVPGRAAEVRASTAKELAATLALELPIGLWSLKASHEWPDDLPEDIDGPAWAGVLPMRTVYGPALPAPDLGPGREVPPSVQRLLAE